MQFLIDRLPRIGVALAALFFASTVVAAARELPVAATYDPSPASHVSADVPDVSWKLIANGGNAPDRAAHAMVYDPVNEAFWSFGGVEADVESNRFHNSVYRLDATDPKALWKLVNIGGLKPPPVAFHTGTYDPLRQRMIVYGGLVDRTLFSDQTPADGNTVWFLDLSTDKPSWSRESVRGNPTRRFQHAAVYVAAHDALVVSGGSDSFSDSHSSSYALLLGEEPLKWVRLANAGFGKRTGHVMAHDAAATRLLVYGGAVGFNSSRTSAEVVALDLSAGLDVSDRWGRITTATPGLSRAFMAAVFDPSTRLWWVHGGLQAANAFLRDLSVLDLNEDKPVWTRTQEVRNGPLDRFLHAAALDATRGRIVFQGGTPDNQITLKDTRELQIGLGVVPPPTQTATATGMPPTATQVATTATSGPPTVMPTHTVTSVPIPTLGPTETMTSPATAVPPTDTPEPSLQPPMRQLFVPLVMRGALN